MIQKSWNIELPRTCQSTKRDETMRFKVRKNSLHEMAFHELHCANSSMYNGLKAIKKAALQNDLANVSRTVLSFVHHPVQRNAESTFNYSFPSWSPL